MKTTIKQTQKRSILKEPVCYKLDVREREEKRLQYVENKIFHIIGFNIKN